MSDRRAAAKLDDEASHVLVVDDDRRIRKLLQTYPERQWFPRDHGRERGLKRASACAVWCSIWWCSMS